MRVVPWAAGLALLLLTGGGSSAQAGTLRIVTSFPPSLIEVYRTAFRKARPDIEIEFIQRKTTAAVAQLAGAERLDADLFWASAPDAFELLKLERQLAPLAPRDTGAPALAAGYPVNDPDGFYLGFALSSYGLVLNERYLAQHHLPMPRSWRDLTAPIYLGHIGISSPSRSGTTHLMVEALLQSEGWEEGWRTWRQIGGNLATVTARSFGVSAGIARARFGIGITIDFLAQPAGLDAAPVRFVFPDERVFAPASIGLLKRAQNREAAEAFVDFLLSATGQRLLLDPGVGRQPVRPEFYADRGEEQPNPFEIETASGWRFDPGRSAERYELVNLLFDEIITFRLSENAEIWRDLYKIEAELAATPDEAAAKDITRARGYLGAMPFSEREAEALLAGTKLVRVPRGLPAPEPQTRLTNTVRDWISRNLRDAQSAVDAARTRLAARNASAAAHTEPASQ